MDEPVWKALNSIAGCKDKNEREGIFAFD